MANLIENASFDATVYRIDQNDAVQGWNGADIGIDNLQAQALANRTQWLKSRVDLGPRITGFDTFTPVSSSQVFNLTPATLLGKHVRANIASFDLELSLPLTTAVSDGGNVSVSAEPGTSAPFHLSQARYVRITPQAGDKIYDAATNQLADEVFVFPYSVVRIHKLEAGKWIFWKVAAKEDAPAGMISAWGANTVPYGWMECNGAAISRAVYANLFANIGTAFGAGNGTTTFNLPDLRGEFIRGWDNSRGVDIDTFILQATTTNGSANVTNADTTGLVAGMSVSGTGIPAGATILSITNSTTFVLSSNATATGTLVSLTVSKLRSFGSSQLDVFKIHSHKIARMSNVVNSSSPTTAAIGDWESASNVQSTDNVQPVGGSETRPRNVALMYLIKF